MEDTQIFFADLQESTVFKNWKKDHSLAFLSHLFCSITAEGVLKTEWEIGYFLPDKEKMEVFLYGKEGFSLKPEDDVFKKPTSELEQLNFEEVKVSFAQAVALWKKEFPQLFPKEQAGDGFIILQTLQGKTVWNFTVISKSIKFLNIKIDAQEGKVHSSQEVELIKKD